MVRRRRGYDQQLTDMGVPLGYRVDEEPPFCWFCTATSGPRSREHVFPRWLQKELRAEGELLRPTHGSATGRTISQRGPIRISALLVGDVCSACNSGWMSDLESDARRILFPNEGRRSLAMDDQITLARWFLKTAIALNTSQNYRLMLPRELRHSVRSGMSPDVGVFLARHDDDRAGTLTWFQGTNLLSFVPADAVDDIAAYAQRVYGVALRVGGLLGTVIYSPPGGWAAPMDEVRRIWPPASDVDWSSLPHVEYLWDPLDLVGSPPLLSSQ